MSKRRGISICDNYKNADYWGSRHLPSEILYKDLKIDVPEEDPLTRWTDLNNLERIIHVETGAYLHRKQLGNWCYKGIVSAKKDDLSGMWLVHLDQVEHIVKLFREYRDRYVTERADEERPEEESEKPNILKLLADVASKLDEQKRVSEQLGVQMKKMEETITRLGSERSSCIFCKREGE